MNKTEPRAVTPLDLPLVRRVIAQGLPLDLLTTLSRGLKGLADAMLASVPLADLGAPTFVLRNGTGGLVGQFRLRSEDAVAQLVLLAPEPQDGNMYDWARLLEAMAFEAGRRGAHSINAEVAEDHPVFAAFRLAGFSVYSRQAILRREPGRVSRSQTTLLRPASERDMPGITALYANTVPRFLQQAEPLPGPECCGLVYERDGQLAAYLAVMEGKSGVVIKPYFHPAVYDQVPAIILAALAHLPRVERVPVYVYARAYQDWLRGALEQSEFYLWSRQALMVKYTVVRIERAELVTLSGVETPLRSSVPDRPVPVHKAAWRANYRSFWRRSGKR